jgi:peptidoglycan/LPS O-acetylase OafA/YrhL
VDGEISDANGPLLRPLMPELNSIRGLACLAVLFFHGLWWYIPDSATGVEAWLRTATQGGYRGVNLFFVLSGLLITNILMNSRSRSDYFTNFYKRRALRILPAYYILLALLFACGVSHAFLILSFVYMSNMAPLLGITMGYGSLWSLAVEEQFYLVWPLVIRRFRTRAVVVLAIGLSVNSLLLSLQLHTNSPQASMPIWFSADGLALGSLLAIFLRSRFANRRNTLYVAGGLAISALAMLRASRHCTLQFAGPIHGTAWDFIFAATLLCALLAGTSRFESLLRPRILLFFGDISYGLYLIHVLVFMMYRRILQPGDGLPQVLAQFVTCSAISITLATVSRFTVEKWFLEQRDRPWTFARLSRKPSTT